MARGKPALSKREVKEVRKIAKQAQRQEQELNFHIYELSGTVSTIGTIGDMSVIAQGVGDQNRVGDQLSPTSMEFWYDWNIADAFNRCRVIVFRWLDNGAPGVSDILLGTTTLPRVFASYNKDNRSKFNVLYDKTHVGALVPASNSILSGSKSRKLTGKINYEAAGTAGNSHIYVLAITDSTTTAHPGLRFYSRINYLP